MNEVGFGRATYPSGRVCRHSGHYIRKTLLEINTMLAVISGVLRRCSRPRHSRPAGHPRLAVTLAAPRRHSRACSGIQFFSLGSWLLALGSWLLALGSWLLRRPRAVILATPVITAIGWGDLG